MIIKGRAYISGTTISSDFPITSNAIQTYQGGGLLFSDAFLAILSSDGSSIKYATFWGGTGDETITSLALGEGGTIYFSGITTSNDLPTTNGAFQESRVDTNDTPDIFVGKLSQTSTDYEITYETYIGGSYDEKVSSIAVDGNGKCWLTGFTNSSDFPLSNSIQNEFAGPYNDGEGDAFVCLLNESGSALDFSTYIGGKLDDQSTGLVLDKDGNVLITGWTNSNDFPTTSGVFQEKKKGIRDRFIAKLKEDGGNWQIDFSTYFGSVGFDFGICGLAIDNLGGIWITGANKSDGLTLVNPIQSLNKGGDSDAFIARLNSTGTNLT